MPRLRRRPVTDPELLELLEASGENTRRAGVLLRDLLDDYPEHDELAADLVRCEHEGDRITHDIIHRLVRTAHGRAPRLLDAIDGHRLACALDDVVDHAEAAADALGVYRVEAPMEQAVLLADVLLGAAEHVALALRCLRAARDMGPHLGEIHRLEHDADRLTRDGIASLFEGGVDPMVVIRWKDIFERLEAAVDACETVAHVLEGIALKRR